MTRRRALLFVLALAALALWAGNASMLAARDAGAPRLLSHRGVHQTYDHAGLQRDTCTADRAIAPLSPTIENTLPAFAAAFAAGAEIVELDVHPTTDGRFAVFHDWRLECRTDGTGETRGADMAALKALDVGYGYTLDGGATFPMRGAGVGLMPTLDEALGAFPDALFLVNVKSRDAAEGQAFADWLAAHPELAPRVWGYAGHSAPVGAAVAAHPGLIGVTRDGIKACVLRYAALGWSGHVPGACRGTILFLPQNVGRWLWGWPARFLNRMDRVGTTVVLRAPLAEGVPEGIDTLEQARTVPEGFDHVVWTNRIRLVAPILLEGG